tara:strand:+ start:80 stop:901 length:822 start_codon:yes stop_codon:yes gene_type:complete
MSNNSSVSSNGSHSSSSSVKLTLSSPRECSYNDKQNTDKIVFKKLTGNSLKLYCNNYQEYLEKQAGFGAKKIHPKNRWGKATTINGKTTKYNLPETLCQCESGLAEEGMEFNYNPELKNIERESRPSSPGFGGKKRKSLKKGRKTSRKAKKGGQNNWDKRIQNYKNQSQYDFAKSQDKIREKYRTQENTCKNVKTREEFDKYECGEIFEDYRTDNNRRGRRYLKFEDTEAGKKEKERENKATATLKKLRQQGGKRKSRKSVKKNKKRTLKKRR